jgi:tRNA pseudouridine55 synthase
MIASVNGLIVIDKPTGMTSHDVVSRLRRFTGEKSIGHLGTLDPMATGVLPLLLGRYTRLAQFFSSAEKSYTGTVRFGFATDTYDAEGQPTTEPVTLVLTLEMVQKAAEYFHGEMNQLPPVFSAKKIQGKPAYKLAREGKSVEMKTARIVIHEFTIEGLSDDTASFGMRVSAGGYVRSVAHEMGEALGCGAHLSSLRRTQAGVFTLAEAVTLDQVAAFAGAGEEAFAALMPHPRNLLPELPAVTADEQTASRMKNGMQVNLPEFSQSPLVRVFTRQRNIFCIARRIAGTLFQPEVVLG